MDPNATWEEMLRLSEEMQRPPAHPGDMMLNGERLAELTLALRDWLAKGGFPPKEFAEEPSEPEMPVCTCGKGIANQCACETLENHPEWW